MGGAASATLEICDASGTRRLPLFDSPAVLHWEAGRIRLGDGQGDRVFVHGPTGRVRFEGDGARPRYRGELRDEFDLLSGETFDWGGAELSFLQRGDAVLEEIELPPPSAAVAPPAPAPERDRAEQRILDRLRAGILVEQGHIPRGVLKRWQERVVQKEFDADACAEEFLQEGAERRDDAHVVERSGRLLRDMLMSSLLQGARGAGRKARTAAKTGMAYLISQVMAVLVFSVLALVFLLALRFKGVGIDAFLDKLLLR